jgi:hypothetical protein
MNRFALLLLLLLLVSGFGYGQAGTAPPAREIPPSSNSAKVNLNDSENASKARALLDQAVEALGGDAYLNYRNRKEEGRYYPLYHGRTNSTGILYNYYIEYPDKSRFEVVHTKDIFLIEGSIGNVKVKNKFDIVQIFNADKGYEWTYRITFADRRIRWNGYSVSGCAIPTWRCFTTV